MKPRLFYAVTPIIAVGLAWSLHQMAARATGPVAAEPESSASASASARSNADGVSPTSKIEGRDWSWRLKPDGSILVLCKGSVVVQSNVVFWGPSWKWVGVEKKTLTPSSGGWTYSAEVPALKTRIEGDYRSPRPHELEITMRVTSAEAMPDAIGGGIHWKTKAKSPALGAAPAALETLPGNAGWSWEPAPGQEMRLTVEPAAAEVRLEAGVRTLLVAGLHAGTRTFRLKLTLPEGAERSPSPEERYEPGPAENWFPDALVWDASPVDLRSLNADDRPAGRRGRVRADGDRLVLGDGTPARFWGANLAAYALFKTPPEVARTQARRMAQLGYNLIRIHHHDSPWVGPNVFGSKPETTRRLDASSLEKIDWWIRCLRDEGIYVWLDIHVGRALLPGDGSFGGKEEVAGKDKGNVKGYSYFNPDVQRLMLEFQRAYLDHVNPHTGQAYKDDPAIAFVLITNENDVTNHFGHMFLKDKGRPFHWPLYKAASDAFAREHGLSADKTWQSWTGGPAALFLADVEHRFNEKFLGELRRQGDQALAATTNYWGDEALNALPPLLDGDVIDAHSYGSAEFLSTDPRYEANYAHWIGAAQVAGMPTTITEWNVEYPKVDRFGSPLYTASLASFQGWDAPMVYNYSQEALVKPNRPTTWSTWCDPAMTGLMPAAALLYRKGQVAPARGGFHMAFPAEVFYQTGMGPARSVAIRTAMEQRRLTIGPAASAALPWLKPAPAPEGAEVVTNADRDLLADGDSGVIRSDTGELTRDWKKGIHVIDAPHCQAVSGWIGGVPIATADARFDVKTKKATLALNSIDDRPLSQSRFILISAVARAQDDPAKRHAFLSEPVVGSITLKTEVADLELMALAADGRVAGRSTPKVEGGAIRLDVPSLGGTHWYVLKSRGATAAP